MFLTENPDGTVRKRKCHLQGHTNPQIQKSTIKPNHDAVAVLDSIIKEDSSKARRFTSGTVFW